MSQALHKSHVLSLQLPIHWLTVYPACVFSCLCPHLLHLWSLHSNLLEIPYRTRSFKPCSNNKNSAEVGFMYEVYLESDIFHQSVCVSVFTTGHNLPQFGQRWSQWAQFSKSNLKGQSLHFGQNASSSMPVKNKTLILHSD